MGVTNTRAIRPDILLNELLRAASQCRPILRRIIEERLTEKGKLPADPLRAQQVIDAATSDEVIRQFNQARQSVMIQEAHDGG